MYSVKHRDFAFRRVSCRRCRWDSCLGISYSVAIPRDYRRFFEERTMTLQTEIEIVQLSDRENREEVPLCIATRSNSARN